MDRAKQTVGQNSAKVAALLVQRGVLHGDTGDVERAKQEIQQAVDMMARTQRGKEDAAATQARIGMGRIYIQAGDSQQAIEILTPIATKELKQKNVDPADVRDAVSTLAVAELNAHHYDRAEADDQRAILLDRQLLGNSHPQTGADIANLAAVKAVMSAGAKLGHSAPRERRSAAE